MSGSCSLELSWPFPWSKKSVTAQMIMSVIKGHRGTSERDKDFIGRDKALEAQVGLLLIVHWLELCHMPLTARRLERVGVF